MRFRKKDYHQKSFKNPYFQKKQKRSPAIGLFFVIFLIVGVSMYLMFFSGFFDIQLPLEMENAKPFHEKIAIEIFAKQQERRKWFFLPRKNIFIFDTKEFEEQLMENFLSGAVQVEKKVFSKTLKIIIEENYSNFVWISLGDAYYINEDGMVLGKVSSQQSVEESLSTTTNIIRHKIVEESLPIIYDIEDKQVSIGSMVTEKSVVDFLTNLTNFLEKSLFYEISHYNFDASKRTLTAIVDEGWEIYFSVDHDYEMQVKNVLLLFSEKIKDTNSIEYIDARFGEKVFYK